MTGKRSPEYTLHDYVQMAVQSYLQQLGDQPPDNFYQLVISETETALLKTILAYTNNNQSKAAQYLGMNRGTLRKKLKIYQICCLDGT